MKCAKYRILVINDEEFLREIVRSMTVSMGHECVCVGTSREALDSIVDASRNGSPFSVGIVDLTIRGESGELDTARRIREVAPDLPLIVTSGYTVHDAILSPENHGFAAALPKPFLKRELDAVLTAVLETKTERMREND